MARERSPVHLFGLSADMDPIVKIAKDRNLIIVEDAACGFGSFYKNKHVGTFGEVGCFSLHPRKSITTGYIQRFELLGH